LVNFTPDDFLNNFQKEVIVANPDGDNDKLENNKDFNNKYSDDEFVFFVRLKTEKNIWIKLCLK